MTNLERRNATGQLRHNWDQMLGYSCDFYVRFGFIPDRSGLVSSTDQETNESWISQFPISAPPKGLGIFESVINPPTKNSNWIQRIPLWSLMASGILLNWLVKSESSCLLELGRTSFLKEGKGPDRQYQSVLVTELCLGVYMPCFGEEAVF